MSSVHAVTEELKFSIRVASFYEINQDARAEITTKVSELMAELGKKHDFLVWRTCMDIEGEKNSGS
jgi:hypothetical protein